MLKDDGSFLALLVFKDFLDSIVLSMHRVLRHLALLYYIICGLTSYKEGVFALGRKTTFF